MKSDHVILSIRDSVATITLHDPATMNALSVETVGELTAALDAVKGKKDRIRCIVLTGAGRAFSAGGNLQGRTDENGKMRRGAGGTMKSVYYPLLRRLRDVHCPLITSVNGAAAGAGMSVALMGDLVIAARSAYFLQAFRHIGLVPDCGSTWVLPRLIGKARAIELSLLGERLPAEKALEWGLINRVVDDADLARETSALGEEVARGPTAALCMMRKLYWESPDNSYEEQLELELHMQAVAGETDDYVEGVTAFLEKRSPHFTGR